MALASHSMMSGESLELGLISLLTVRRTGQKPPLPDTSYFLVGVNWLRWPDQVPVNK